MENNGEVRIRKRKGTDLRRGLNTINDEVRSISDTVYKISTFAQMVSDFVKNIVGLTRGEAYRSGDRGGYRQNYRSYYGENKPSNAPERQRDPDLDSFDYIEFLGRGRAEKALWDLQDILDREGVVSVGKLFDIVHQSCPYTYWDYGWTDLDDVRAIRAHDDWYVLDLPAARYIGNKR